MLKISKLALTLVPAAMLAFNVSAADDEQPEHKPQKSPKGAKAYIVNLKDGRTVKANKKGEIKVIFGLTGMGICPAGITASGVPIPNTGHHHLLVDDPKVDLKKPLPADQPDTIKHFGKGQTETTLKLKPGKHTLQLVLGDYAHVPHVPPVMSKKITITVK